MAAGKGAEGTVVASATVLTVAGAKGVAGMVAAA